MSSPMALVTDRFSRRLAGVLAGVVALALLAGGCVSTSLKAGQTAEQSQDYDRAVVEYPKVVKEHPDNRDARMSLDRAKLRAALDHYNRGLRLRNGGRLDEALVELQIASELNPASGDIDAALSDVRSQLRTKVAVTKEGKTQLETLIERSRDLPPVGLDLPTDAQMPAVLTFSNASSRDVFTAIARFARVNVTFDQTFRDQPVTIDLRNTTLEAALQAVAASTRNFYRVTAQRTITVVPDTPAKRREYEEEVVRTFFLSNADVKETMDLLRIVIDLRRVAPTAAANALTIKDTPERVAAAGRLITAIDKARPEVVIDVELLEVDRTRLREFGLQLASPGSPGIDGAATITPDPLTLRDLLNLTQSDILLTNLPGLFYRLLKTDSEHPHAGQPAAAHVGRHSCAGQVRRAGAGTGHDLLAHRHRRRRPAADHLVQLREHRCEHRHHAAHAPRRSGDAGAQDLHQQHLRHRLRQPADLRQSRNQHRDPAEGRRDQPARRPHSRRRAPDTSMAYRASATFRCSENCSRTPSARRRKPTSS